MPIVGIERLDEAIDRLVGIARTRPDLREWMLPPIDPQLLDQLVDAIAPWQFAAEHLHMAKRERFFPGYSGWGGDWMTKHGVKVAVWQSESMKEIRRRNKAEPSDNPSIKWVTYAHEEKFHAVVPVMKEPFDSAPIGFTEGIDFVDIRFPSLTAYLETFLSVIEHEAEYQSSTNSRLFINEETPNRFLNTSWWHDVLNTTYYNEDSLPVWQSPMPGHLADQIKQINSPDQSTHPAWLLPKDQCPTESYSLPTKGESKAEAENVLLQIQDQRE